MVMRLAYPASSMTGSSIRLDLTLGTVVTGLSNWKGRDVLVSLRSP